MSSTKLRRLQEEAQAAAKSARTIAEKADAAERSMTEDEKAEFDGHMAKGRDLLEQIKVAKADEQVLADAKALAEEIGEPAVEDLAAQGEVGGGVKERVKSLGLQVVESTQFKGLMESFGGRVPEKARVQSDPISVKSLFTGDSSTSAGAFVVPEQTGIVEMLGRRNLTIRDLISVRRTGSDAVEYVAQTSHTNNAAPVPEATTSAGPTANTETGALELPAGSGVKPEGAWAFERKTANVITIAEWVPATKRSLADVAALEGLINDELRADLAEEEEDQIVSGDGTGENLTGILETSGIQTQAGFASGEDMTFPVRRAITKARTVGRVVPNGIAMSPEDVEALDLLRDGNDRFYGAGPFSMGPRTLWGLPIVETESMTAGTALVGDFSKAVLWDREQTTVTVTDSHADFFVRNLVAILAEERVAFAVTRPKAFVETTLTSAGG